MSSDAVVHALLRVLSAHRQSIDQRIRHVRTALSMRNTSPRTRQRSSSRDPYPEGHGTYECEDCGRRFVHPMNLGRHRSATHNAKRKKKSRA